MRMRSRLLSEAERGISNPFLLCALISQRTRQLMITRNASTSTAQLVDSALEELIAGALKFERVGRERSPWVEAEVHVEESNDELASHRAPTAASDALPVEAP
jgi:hypothetical protein